MNNANSSFSHTVGKSLLESSPSPTNANSTGVVIPRSDTSASTSAYRNLSGIDTVTYHFNSQNASPIIDLKKLPPIQNDTLKDTPNDYKDKK